MGLSLTNDVQLKQVFFYALLRLTCYETLLRCFVTLDLYSYCYFYYYFPHWEKKKKRDWDLLGEEKKKKKKKVGRYEKWD